MTSAYILHQSYMYLARFFSNKQSNLKVSFLRFISLLISFLANKQLNNNYILDEGDIFETPAADFDISKPKFDDVGAVTSSRVDWRLGSLPLITIHGKKNFKERLKCH